MRESKEFNREGDADVEKVVKRTGPLGLLPIMYLVATLVLVLLALFFWWR